MTDFANPLSASSVLLAILAILYGAWYADIKQTSEIILEDQKANRTGQRTALYSALWTKALPLALGSTITSLIFVARTLDIVAQSLSCKASAGCQYDDVQAAFVAIELFVILITAAAWLQAGGLIGKLINSYK